MTPQVSRATGRGRGRRLLAAFLASALSAAALVGLVAAPAEAVPTGFALQTMPQAGLIEPAAVEFASTGQVFVAERRGVVKVFDNLDDATSSQVADLRLRVFNNGDRGLLGMALDPTYPARPYLWLLYTKDADPGGPVPKYGNATGDTDSCPDAGANDCRVTGELTRITLDPSTGVWTGQENVLLTGWCQQYGSHSIADLGFGADGSLYVSSGDGANYNVVDTGNVGTQTCPDPAGWGGALRAQSPRRPAAQSAVFSGALLRIDPDTGAAWPGNPFAANPDPVRQRVLAYGLRNPFRFAVRPGSSQVWLGDVGWNTTEEIDKVDADATAENFGWPCYEGSARQSGYDAANVAACEDLYAQGSAAVTPPVFAYDHGAAVGGTSCPTGSSSISGIAFSTSTTYPAAYRGGVFFADYARGCLWYAPVTGDTVGTPVTFDNASYIADLQVGPNGDVYGVDIGLGLLRRIAYTAGGNTPPIAVARASVTSGPLPLTVTFDGRGSSDPDPTGSITYAWDLDGDGAFDDSTAVSPTWTYTTRATVTARLRVTDDLGATATAAVVINAGNTAPVPVLTSSASTTPWAVGDTVSFTASAVDPEDGPLPASSLSTQLVIEHCPGSGACHEHPQQTFVGAGGSFVAPDHEYPAWVSLRLTATDANGLAATTTLRLDPATVNLTFASNPSGLQVVVGSQSRTTPFTVPVIRGSLISVAAPSPQVLGGSYQFASWSDGGAAAHNVTATGDATLTATFAQYVPPTPAGLVGAWSFEEGAGTTAADSSGLGNNGTLGGGASWTTAGRYGRALTFDGVSGMVSIPGSSSLDLAGPLTLTAWVRPSSLGVFRTAVLKERPAGLSYALYATGESGAGPDAYVNIGGVDKRVAGGTTSTGNWTHLAMTYDGAAMRLYAGGVLVGTTAQTGAVTQGSGALRIGGNTVWSEWFAGQIDEVRVYNRALSATEVVTDSQVTTAADTVPPTQPTNLLAQAGPAAVTLSWLAATDDRGPVTYEIHRSLTSGFVPSTATRLASGVATATWTDSGLAPGTYYYRVIASDGTNLGPASAQASATVTGDVTPPAVPSGVTTTVSGTTATVSWLAASDDVATTGYDVQRVVGTTTSVRSVGAAVLSITDTGLAADTYLYSVRARDAAGNLSGWSSPVAAQVVVDASPPTVSVTAPAAGATVSGTVALAATATDDVAVAGVTFRVDGVTVGAEDTTAPYTGSWSSTAVPNGTHTVTAVARDTAGKTTTSAAVGVTVANAGPAGLVGAWSFDEGTGLTAADVSGSGNTATLENGVAWTTAGKYGGALTFDGVNDLVTIADAASLDVTGPMTLSAWVRPTALGAWRNVLTKENGTGLAYALYATNASQNRPAGVLSVAGANRTVTGTSATAANAWTHLALTYDRTAIRLYVNGVLVRSTARTGAVATSAGPLRIGGNSRGELFTGQLDEVRVYNRALTAAEVVTIRDIRL